MTTKELTALAREAFGDGVRTADYRAPLKAHVCEAYTAKERLLLVRGDTRAEAKARFVACLRAIKEMKRGS